MSVTDPDNSGNCNLSLEDSLRKRRLETELGFQFEDCSRDNLINLILDFSRKADLLDATAKESIIGFTNSTFDVNVPEQPKPELGLFTNLIVQFLQNNDLTIYYKGQPHKSSLIAEEILAQSDNGIEWLNYCVSCSIANLTENQLRAFSDDDVAMVDTLIKCKTLSIYLATKVLKQLVDRLASTAFLKSQTSSASLSNQSMTNETFTNNESFLKLVQALYSLCFTGYPVEDN